MLENFNFSTLFIISSVFGVIATIITLFLIKSHSEKKYETTFFGKGTKKTILDLLPIYLVIVAYSAALGLISTIFPEYANNLGINSFGIGILFAISGTTTAISTLFVNYISRIGIKLSLLLGLVIQASSLAAISYFLGFFNLSIILALYGITIGIHTPLTLSTISQIASKEKVGLAIGVSEAFFGLGNTIGPFIGGISAQYFGATSPYIVLGSLSAFTIIPLYLKKLKIK